MPPEKPFISRESYMKYSVIYAEFRAKCTGRYIDPPRQYDLDETITFEHGAKASKKIEPARVSKVTSDKKKKIEEDDRNIEEQGASGTVQSAFRYSSLNKVEHVTYLKLLEKYKKNSDFKLTGSADQQQDLMQFTALQRKVSLEREEFMNHLKNLALTRRRKNYFFIFPDAKQFVTELLKTELNAFYKECQSYYSTMQIIPLLAPGVDPMEKDSLSFIKNILKLGQVSRLVLPGSQLYVMRAKFKQLRSKFLQEKTMGQDVHPSKQNILRDSIACNLSLKYEADIVTTLKSLSTLLDNLHPNLEHSWEIPIMVITDSYGANGKIKKRVFLENPIPSTDMSVREQNTLYHDYVAKFRLAFPDHHTVKRQQFSKLGNLVELEASHRELRSVDDTFGDLNQEAIDLDTFGITSSVKQLNLNIKSTLTDDAEKSSSGIQRKDLTSLDYLKIPSRGGQILQDATTTTDAETPSNGNLISQNSTTTDHMEISSAGNLIPENSTTKEDVTKSSSTKQITETPTSNSDSDEINDAEQEAFLKLKEIIIQCDKMERAEEEQEMSTLESGIQQNQDSDSDDLVIDTEKDEKPTLPLIEDKFILDENEISIIREVMAKKKAIKREKEINSSNDNAAIIPDVVPKVENFESSWEENIVLHDKSPKSREEKKKLYKKKSTKIVGHPFESSDDMILDIKSETTKTKRQRKRRSLKSSERESSNSSPMQLRRREVFRYFEDHTKSSENTSLHRTGIKQKNCYSTSSENEALHSSPLQLRRRTVYRNIEDNSMSSGNTSHSDSTALKKNKSNSRIGGNESSRSSIVLRGSTKVKTIKEEPQSSKYQENILPPNSIMLNVSNDRQKPPKVNIKREKLEDTLQPNSTSLNASTNCQKPAKNIITKNLSEAHSSNSICPKLEVKPQEGTLEQILGLQKELFNKSPISSADKDKRSSLFDDSFPKQSDAMEEAPKEFPQLLNGNVSYSLWRLGQLKLMLRSEVDCQIPNASTTPCFFFSKMEYQSSNGLEVTTPSELMRQWIALKTYPGSQIVRMRIDTSNSELKMLEDVTLAKLMNEHKFHPDRATHQASTILNTLTGLSDGHYMLVHKAQEPTLTLFKSVQTSKYGALDFQKSLSQRISALDDQDCDNSLHKDVPWLPIDPEIILQRQKQKQLIPGCFIPQECGRQRFLSRRGGRNCWNFKRE